MDWLNESWALISSWGVTLVAVIALIRATYAAERDRQALNQSALEREKLSLEIEQLRNSPAIVAERREIYDNLAAIVSTILGSAAVEIGHIGGLHKLRHDAEFRYPQTIVQSIQGLIVAVVDFHVSNQMVRNGPRQMTDDQWSAYVSTNHDALMKIAAFQNGLVEMFRPYLSL